MITGIVWNTEEVMARYRTGGLSGLEASRKLGGPHRHVMGDRCGCGYLAVPARFYERNDKTGVELSHEQAEANCLAWLGSDEKPAYVDPPVMAELSVQNVRTENVRTPDVRTCAGCGERPAAGRDKTCSASQKAAYRGRLGQV